MENVFFAEMHMCSVSPNQPNKRRRRSATLQQPGPQASSQYGKQGMQVTVQVGFSWQACCMQVAMTNGQMGRRLHEDEVHELMATIDVDGNGLIDYEEFVAATVNLNKLEKEEHCKRVCVAKSLANECHM